MSTNDDAHEENLPTPVEEKPIAELDAEAAVDKSLMEPSESVVLAESAPSVADVEELKQAEVESDPEVEVKESALMSVPEIIEERKLRPEILPHAFVVMPLVLKKVLMARRLTLMQSIRT